MAENGDFWGASAPFSLSDFQLSMKFFSQI
jgi:hypothetical protein